MKKISISMVILLSGATSNISGSGDYSKYIKTPEQRISYQIAQNLHEHKIKDLKAARTQRGIDSLRHIAKNIKP